jgi:hypothetical protein
MSYTGNVSVDGPADTRELPGLVRRVSGGTLAEYLGSVL